VAARAGEFVPGKAKAWAGEWGESLRRYVIARGADAGGAARISTRSQVTNPVGSDHKPLEAHRTGFWSTEFNYAWSRVLALVVQPGWNSDHHKVIDYEPARRAKLSRRIEHVIRPRVMKAHST